MELNKDSVYSVLGGIEDPAKRKDVVSLGYVTSVDIGVSSLEVVLTLPSPPTPLKKDLRNDCRKALIESFPNLDDVDVFLEYMAAESTGRSGGNTVGEKGNASGAGGGASGGGGSQDGGASQEGGGSQGGGASQGGGSGRGPAGKGPQRPGAGGMMNAETPESLKDVKYTIAVASGKGGVGKSTVAVNLAAALSRDGARVGILDADVYGPSLPVMLHVNQQPKVNENEKILPLTAYGMKLMSIGFLADENAPFIWRGPMASGAIGQFIKEVEWGELDYLIFDLPPGTGDVQLTIVQTLPISGSVIVTTPQNLALADATRAQQMFHKVDVPVTGLVENMSYYVCPECGHRDELFDSGGGERSAADLGVPFLGAIPLYSGIRRWSDLGTPFVLAEPESEHAVAITRIARALGEKLPIE